MKKTYTGWRALLWFIATYHLILGLLLLFSGELSIRALKVFAGATIEGSPQLGIVGEILACYLLAFGLMMGIAAWNPVKNRAIITAGLVLIALRLFQRLFFAAKVMQVFQVTATHYWSATATHYWSATAIATILGLLLGMFRWRIYRDMHGEE